MNTIQLKTHTKDFVVLPEESYAESKSYMVDKVFSLERAHGEYYKIRANGKVGLIQLGDIRLEITAHHMSWQTLLDLACVHYKVQLSELRVNDDTFTGFIEALCRTFLHSLSKLFQRGLRREYKNRTARSETLRGEIQFAKWFGPNSPGGGLRPPCRFRERAFDIPEHQAFASCLKEISTSSLLDPTTRAKAIGLKQRLSGVDGTTFKTNSFSACRRDGLFFAYARPLALAEIILLGIHGIAQGDKQGCGFILDADQLFEKHVGCLLKTYKPDDWRLQEQESIHLDLDNDLLRRMDCTLRDASGNLRLIVDAKNKDLVNKHVNANDVNQVLSYMATTGCKHGMLVGLGAECEYNLEERRFRGEIGNLDIVGLPAKHGLEVLDSEFAKWFQMWLKQQTPQPKS